MYRKEEFRRWMESKTKLSPNSIIYYLSYLDDSDRLFDVDAKILDLGTGKFLKWINSVDFSSSSARPNDIRSGVRKYVAFHIDTQQRSGAGSRPQQRPDEASVNERSMGREPIEEFRKWMESQPERFKETSIASYTSNLRRTVSHLKLLNDPAFDLDAKLQNLGPDGFERWIATEDFSAFPTRPRDTRSHLRAYAEFRTGAQQLELGKPESDFLDADRNEEVANPRLFRMEKQMQAAVRAQLEELEPGLVADDDGREVSVATGRIDIVARDKDSKPVVIELKAGDCPAGALEQVLGYAADLEDERGEEVRAYLIAGSFPDRTRAAARRMTGLELRTYEFSVRFNPPDQA